MAVLSVGCTLSSVPPPAATQIPAPTPIPGAALLFDGRDDYVVVEDDPSLDLHSAFTIAAWIYLEDYAGWASLVTKGDKPNISNYAIHQSEPLDPTYGTEFGKLRVSGCFASPSPLPESETVLALKRWHFVAITFDGARIRFYLNGLPDGSGEVTGPLCTNNQPLYIGVDFPLTTEYWHGAIDELKIWNVALTESQIRDEMQGSPVPSDAGLVGYWRFDEGAGSIAHDSSIYANHGQLMGESAWISRSSPVP